MEFKPRPSHVSPYRSKRTSSTVAMDQACVSQLNGQCWPFSLVSSGRPFHGDLRRQKFSHHLTAKSKGNITRENVTANNKKCEILEVPSTGFLLSDLENIPEKSGCSCSLTCSRPTVGQWNRLKVKGQARDGPNQSRFLHLEVLMISILFSLSDLHQNFGKN